MARKSSKTTTGRKTGPASAQKRAAVRKPAGRKPAEKPVSKPNDPPTLVVSGEKSSSPAKAEAKKDMAAPAKPVESATVPKVAEPAKSEKPVEPVKAKTPSTADKPAETKPVETVPAKSSAAPSVSKDALAAAAPEVAKEKGTVADDIKPADTNETKGTETMAEAKKVEPETIMNKAKEYASEFGSKAKATATEMGAFTKDNFEAIVESGKIASEGTANIAKDNMAFTKKSIEDFSATAKDFSSVKNPSELIKKQGDFVRKSFDENMAQMTKTTEAFMKLMGDAYQPISTRMSVAAEKVKAAAA